VYKLLRPQAAELIVIILVIVIVVRVATGVSSMIATGWVRHQIKREVRRW
jgi:hypothetical protein